MVEDLGKVVTKAGMGLFDKLESGMIVREGMRDVYGVNLKVLNVRSKVRSTWQIYAGGKTSAEPSENMESGRNECHIYDFFNTNVLFQLLHTENAS
jgi:hypothetical protein